jgi:hypothetical protein
MQAFGHTKKIIPPFSYKLKCCTCTLKWLQKYDRYKLRIDKSHDIANYRKINRMGCSDLSSHTVVRYK